jgi:hypothetical protein
MSETSFDRRAEDKRNEAKLQAELDALIAAENDPSKLANLMVLNAINRSLTHNTSMTHNVNEGLSGLKKEFTAHVDNFANHAKIEEALLNKGRGAWMALAWFLGVLQVIVGYVIMDTRDSMRQVETNTHLAQMADQKIITRIEILEAAKK